MTCDPDSSVEKDYFRAAAQSGIPCCFIVGKSGLIEWLGHPMEMDEPLQAVVDGSWDREKMGAPIRKEQEAALEQAKFQERAAPVIEKLQAGEMEEGLKMLEAMLSEATPVQKGLIHDLRFKVQMSQENHDKAANALTDLAGCEGVDPLLINQYAWATFEMSKADSDFSKPLLDASALATEKAVSITPDDWMILDTFAHLLHKQGHLDRAIEVQTKALKNPGPAEADIRAFLEQLTKEKTDK